MHQRLSAALAQRKPAGAADSCRLNKRFMQHPLHKRYLPSSFGGGPIPPPFFFAVFQAGIQAYKR